MPETLWPVATLPTAALPGMYDASLGVHVSSSLRVGGYAGFGQRFVALVVDGLLMIVTILPISFLMGVFIGVAGAIVDMPPAGRTLVAKISAVVFGVLVRWFYFAGCESSTWQATLGKRLVRICVTDLNGQRISFGSATKRFFAKYISAVALGFGYWSVLWNPRSQGWHDQIADTLVVEKRSS